MCKMKTRNNIKYQNIVSNFSIYDSRALSSAQCTKMHCLNMEDISVDTYIVHIQFKKKLIVTRIIL